MNTDLDTRLARTLTNVATSTRINDDALATIIRRADRRQASRRPNSWLLAGGATAIVAVATVATLTNHDQKSGPPTLAMVQLPALTDPNNDCGDVTSRAAEPSEAAAVSFLPSVLPDGYVEAGEPSAFAQIRGGSGTNCWNADITYADAATGRLLTASVQRQGSEVKPGCQLPEGYRPAVCVTVGDRPAALTDEGSRARISWITDDDHFAYVSAFGLTDDELLSAAATLTFDGTNVTVQAPTGMERIEDQPRSRTDNRDVTYFGATFSNGDPAADISLSITTWNDISINEVGPATTFDLDGTTAVMVTTGGPGTGITGWANEVQTTDQPTASYITWNRNGITFRIAGPDPDALLQIAQSLQLA